MNWTREIERAFAARDRSADADVVTELAQHAEAAYAAARADGVDTAAARERVRALIDGWCGARPASARRPATALPPAPPSGSSGLAGLGLDVAYGLRLLRRQPGATLLTVTTLALAIGATTTLASVAYGVLARPLPWPQADRLVRLAESREGGTISRPIVTNLSYRVLAGRGTALDGLGAFMSVDRTLTADNQPIRVQTAGATTSLFDLLGARPLRGRLFTAGDETASDVAVVSERLWRQQFGASDDAVGRVVTLDDDRVAVIGVLPNDFRFPDLETDVWTPMHVRPFEVEDGEVRSVSFFGAIGRLAPGATATQASDEATAAVRGAPPVGMVATAVFGSQGPATVSVTPLAEAMTAEVRPAVLVLLAGVGLLFVTAIGGLAAMQVARSLSRRREVAIRAALGAGSGRLARQLVVEHLAAGLAGGAAGLGLAAVCHQALPALLPADFPRLQDVVLDWRIGVLAAGLAVLASLATTTFPVLHARRLDLVGSLADGGQAPVGGGLRSPVARLRAIVVVAQVGATVVLLVGAGLVGRSFLALINHDRGYDPVNLLTARLPLGSTHPRAIAQQTFDDIVSRLSGRPGVLRASYGGFAPFMSGGSLLAFQLEDGNAGVDEPRNVKAELALVSPGFIEALGMRIEEGRAFGPSDTITSEPVAIVNRAFAREYFGERTLNAALPLSFLDGQRTPEPHDEPPARDAWRVVGIVQDLAPARVTDPSPATIYVSTAQLDGQGFAVSDARFVIRTTGDPAAMAPVLATIVRELVPAVPLASVMTMEDRISTSLSRPRLYAVLLTAFSGFALLVAALGLFAMLSHGVAARRRELGVRLALGATRLEVLRLVLRDGLVLTMAGVTVGTGVTLVAGRYVEALLFGVTTRDPASFVIGITAVVAGALIASGVPAARASKVDPIEVLRSG